MISLTQLQDLTKKYKIAESVILREYLQVWFLSLLYAKPFSNDIFFKGGTAIHLLFDAPRFSEDLDFTVTMPENDFSKNVVKNFFTTLPKIELVAIKQKDSIAGATFRLQSQHPTSGYKIFINLDFSFREKVFEPTKTILRSEYPVLFTSLVSHLSGPEIVAEKIRAILKRQKGRDLYDLWYLFTKNISMNTNLIQAKLDYYQMVFDPNQLKMAIANFPESKFVEDLKPFVGTNERAKLPELYNYIQTYFDQLHF